ncbi:hypothetical protein ACVPOW_02220 [Staphylococcus aureus]
MVVLEITILFDLTRPLRRIQKRMKVVKNGEMDSITWY